MSKETTQEAAQAPADSPRSETDGKRGGDAAGAGDRPDGTPSKRRGSRRGRRRRPRGAPPQDRAGQPAARQGAEQDDRPRNREAQGRSTPREDDHRAAGGPGREPKADRPAADNADARQADGTRKRRRRRRPRRTTGSARPQDRDAAAPDHASPAAQAKAPLSPGPTDSAMAFPDEDDWDFRADGTAAADSEDGHAGETMPVHEHPEDEQSDGDSERRPCCLFAPPAAALDPDGEDAVSPDLPEETGDAQATLRNVVMVYFGAGHTLAGFDCGPLDIRAGDQIIVESDRGLISGTAATSSARQMVRKNLSRVVRLASPKDSEITERNASRQREAYQYCRERIEARGLPMKLIRTEYLHGGNKALFYFSADNRVDFRDLVRDLARQLRTKIEMRQVGVRDESKVSGGLGPCGRELCCSSWINSFQPVSIRMAKDQGLVLNPHRVSGMCGRLKCCLAYEQDLYHEARRGLPKPGQQVRTPEGTAVVNELDIPRQLVRVVGGDGTFATYPADQVATLSDPEKRQPRRR